VPSTAPEFRGQPGSGATLPVIESQPQPDEEHK